jgi:hypothetical protein
MRLSSRLCVALLGVALLGIGCWSPSTQAQTPASAPNAAAAPAADTSVTDKNKNPLNVAFAKAARKYKMAEKDGKQLYCRKETQLGTRLAKTVCLSKDELTDLVIASQQARDTLTMPRASQCGTSSGCN